MNIAMTIAGSDCSGGAGIQADLKTFQELGVYGTSVITALTAQNTMAVSNIAPVPATFVAEQFEMIMQDMPVHAIKTGMLFSSDIINTVSDALSRLIVPIIVDPVMIAKGGANLLKQEANDALIHRLIPLATVVTPNIPEAEVITGKRISSEKDIYEAAEQILKLGPTCVVMKGGHLQSEYATDYIFSSDHPPFTLTSARINTKHTHGTGCTYSAALTALLAKRLELKEALQEAKNFITAAIAEPLHIGHGHGPTNHFAYKQNKYSEGNVHAT